MTVIDIISYICVQEFERISVKLALIRSQYDNTFHFTESHDTPFVIFRRMFVVVMETKMSTPVSLQFLDSL